MKIFLRIVLALTIALSIPAIAEDLVILTTNDTHSNIESNPDGTAGVLPRKAIIDSVRKAEKNVLLIDAGDMVQGSLYFNFFRGDVEYPLFNKMGYDIRILGNHEFDNGLKELAEHWKETTADALASNYDFSDTPANGIFKPYAIKKVDGKKIGLIGINIDPTSIISDYNYKGMKWEDPIKAANKWAVYLKDKKKCDLVVAVTHIGYTTDVDKPTDIDLARSSKDIDIIIGGHSHSFVDPKTPDTTPYWIKNAVGKPVLVTQTGKYGKNIGYIKIDLDDLEEHDYDYEWIPVTDRFPASKLDRNIIDFLKPYKAVVDSINHNPIGWSDVDMDNSSNAYANWTADFGRVMAQHIADSINAAGGSIPEIDLAVMNRGGIRQPMRKGVITEGEMLSTFPFSNVLQIVSMKGSDIIETMKQAAAKGGEAVSSEIRVSMDKNGNVENVVYGYDEIDPDKDYTVATIDYVSQGNDGLFGMKNHRMLWSDANKLSSRVIEYIRKQTSLGVPVTSDPSPRFLKMHD